MNQELRTVFDEYVELYHTFRPHYPEGLFKRLITITKLKNRAKLLEIGPGTGQATQALASHGYDITAIELGGNLAKKARKVLAKFPNVKVITGAYEDVSLPANSYDLVLSATAFHWLKPETKFTKTHHILVPGGYLAIIHTEHVSDENGDKFFLASKPLYDKYTSVNGATLPDKNFQLPTIASLNPPEKVDEKLFSLKDFSIFPLTLSYSAHDYVALLATYSPHIALEPSKREAFLRGIEDLINQRFAGQVDKHYAMTLTIAQRIDLG